MTLRASRTAVRGGESSEVRLPMTVEAVIGRSETPAQWGMGGAAADSSLATAVRRARAETKPHNSGVGLDEGLWCDFSAADKLR